MAAAAEKLSKALILPTQKQFRFCSDFTGNSAENFHCNCAAIWWLAKVMNVIYRNHFLVLLSLSHTFERMDLNLNWRKMLPEFDTWYEMRGWEHSQNENDAKWNLFILSRIHKNKQIHTCRSIYRLPAIQFTIFYSELKSKYKWKAKYVVFSLVWGVVCWAFQLQMPNECRWTIKDV